MRANHEYKDGFTLIEVVTVIGIIGLLVSISIPIYQDYRETAKEKACLATRRNMLLNEADHYLSTGVFLMELDDRYQCPSGGIYVWVFPEGADHPNVVCSLHGDPGGGATTPTTGKDKTKPVKPTQPQLPEQAKPPDHAQGN